MTGLCNSPTELYDLLSSARVLQSPLVIQLFEVIGPKITWTLTSPTVCWHLNHDSLQDPEALSLYKKAHTWMQNWGTENGFSHHRNHKRILWELSYNLCEVTVISLFFSLTQSKTDFQTFFPSPRSDPSSFTHYSFKSQCAQFTLKFSPFTDKFKLYKLRSIKCVFYMSTNKCFSNWSKCTIPF